MKAVVFHGVGDIRLDDVPEPRIEHPNDALVRITASAICGTDLHLIRGTFPGMRPGTILGHEGVGVIEELGPGVRNFNVGDRVVIPSTIGCGYCAYCRVGYYAQCDVTNPNGSLAGTAFFGGPESSGPFHGLQAEYARIPFANANLVKLPDEVTDDQAILVSDIFPTGYFAADIAEIRPGNAVAIFGCGPVGQFTIASAKLFEAGRIIAVDSVPSRLEMARGQGAEVIDFNAEDPVEVIRELTGGIGVDRVIDAVGVDAMHPERGPALDRIQEDLDEFRREIDEIAPEAQRSEHWIPGDAPSLALRWAVDAVCKAGTLCVVGAYPPTDRAFPIGKAMNKNLTINMGNCNHRKYIPELLDFVQGGRVDPLMVLTNQEPLSSAIEAFEHFSHREPGWMKVELKPELEPALS